MLKDYMRVLLKTPINIKVWRFYLEKMKLAKTVSYK